MRRHTEQSYLVRLWRDHADAALRATVVPITASQHYHHFASLDELLYFLNTQTSVAQMSDVEQVRPAPTDSVAR